MKKTIQALTALSLLALGQTVSQAATGDVTLSGSTGTLYVGGVAVASNAEAARRAAEDPGTAALIQRLAHVLYQADLPLIPRMMTEWAHSRTGIDIHPGAKIGSHFFIDHGTGVVIGETCEIGARVKLYHVVTLGARSFQKDERGKIKKGGKRHPTVEDDVTIYPNSTVLGGETVIGARSTIGGNVFLVQSVPPDSLVYYEETQLRIVPKRRKTEGRSNGFTG
jgi:serine O-acetyltransferase